MAEVPGGGERRPGSAPGGEWVWVERREGRRGFEAVAVMRVAWAAWRAEGRHDQERLFRALGGCLEAGQKLAVVLEGESGAQRVAAAVEVAATGRTRSDSRARARDLAARVRATLGAFGAGLGLEPGPPSVGSRRPHRIRIRPACVEIPVVAGGVPGFAREPGAGPAVLVLPLPEPCRGTAEELAETLARLGGRAVLQVGCLRPPALPAGLLDRAEAHLLDGREVLWDGAAWSPCGEAVEALRSVLDAWRRAGPSAWALSCVLESDRPLPPGLRDLACAVVFGTRRSRRTPAPGVDLSAWRPAGMPLPALLPGPEVLARGGVPRGYPTRQVPCAREGVLLGEARTPAGPRPVRLPYPDRSRHVYVVGATGTGKSTLLYNMIVQDVRAGNGVGLIDPHGDLFRQVLRAIPPERAGDVVLVDLTDFGYVPGLNLLEVSGPFPDLQKGFVVNEMIRIFDRLYDLHQTGGPIFEQYMRNALLLALNARDHAPTLLDACRIFENDAFREELLRHCTDPDVVRFWEGQAHRALGDASLSNLAPYITSKVNQFAQNPLVRDIVGQVRTTVDFRGILDRGGVLLVNLAKGVLGDLDSRLLGMIVMGKVFQAGLARAPLPEARRRPFHLYVDEFQNFSTETVSDMLAEARKFGLRLVLANQSLQQINQYAGPGMGRTGGGGVLPAVLGNAGTLVVFRTGPLDAPHLVPFVEPGFRGRDLQELPDYHAVVRLLVHGRPFPPFALRTFPPAPAEGRVRCARAIRRLSRARYARPRPEVEAEIRVARVVHSTGSPMERRRIIF